MHPKGFSFDTINFKPLIHQNYSYKFQCIVLFDPFKTGQGFKVSKFDFTKEGILRIKNSALQFQGGNKNLTNLELNKVFFTFVLEYAVHFYVNRNMGFLILDRTQILFVIDYIYKLVPYPKISSLGTIR